MWSKLLDRCRLMGQLEVLLLRASRARCMLRMTLAMSAADIDRGGFLCKGFMDVVRPPGC